MWVCACEYGCPQKPEASAPLKLELQTVVSCLIWVPGTELGSPGRAVSALSHFSNPRSFVHYTWKLYLSELKITVEI